MYLVVIVETEMSGHGVDQIGVGSSESIDGLLGVAHPIGVSIAFCDNFGEAIEYFQLDGVGILELVHHHKAIVVADIVDDLFLLCDEIEKQALHVVVGDDVLPFFVGNIVISPLFGKREDGTDEWFKNLAVGGRDGLLIQ